MSRGVKGLIAVIVFVIAAAFMLGKSSGSHGAPVATATPEPQGAINAAVAATVNARALMAPPMMPVAAQNPPLAYPVATTPVPVATVQTIPTNAPPPSATPVPATASIPPPPPATPTPTVEMFNRIMTTCYGACKGGVPNQILQNQMVLVHGDLTNSGTQCNYKIYRPGEKVPSTYGRGTFQIVLIQGTPEFIDASITGDVRGAAGAAPTGTCPQI